MQILTTQTEISNYIQEKISKFYKSQSLFPFLGSGFSKGAKARRYSVIDGTECKQKMIEQVVFIRPELENEIGQLNDFDEVADLFYQFVPKESIKDFIFNYFTGIRFSLGDPRINFLRLKWKQIYTLNIDDGIEKTNGYGKILPNRRIDKQYIDYSVIKLHGDAFEETVYLKNEDGIIFSRKQYLKSLIENKDLLNLFLEDYYGKNMLFIGCSLINETDLDYILANDTIKSSTISEKIKTDKIYVSTEQLTPLRKIRLENFGINVYIQISNYADFYNEINEVLDATEILATDIFKPFSVTKFEIINELTFNKNIITGDSNIEIRDCKLSIPSFYIQRTKTTEIIEKLKSESIIFVIGKRVSGKSFFSINVLRALKNEKVLFFPSKYTINSSILETIKERDDEIYIFDTDTLGASDIEDIYYLKSDYERRGLKFVFVINSSDRLMLSIPYTKVVDAVIIELDNKLDKNEVASINNGLSRIGLIKFKGEDNFLTNIMRYKTQYNNTFKHEVEETLRKVSPKYLSIFILNASFEKVYSSIFRAISVDYEDIKEAIAISKRAIEFEFNLKEIESSQHSNYKVITNSKLFLFQILSSYSRKDPSAFSEVSNTLFDIVNILKKYDRFVNYWKTIISFDTLNQIFYKPGYEGSIKLIFSFYEKLEQLLYNESHFWMQRAKSIFYIKRVDILQLKIAIDYTKKAYYDAYAGSRIKINSSFQIAQIYNRIVILQDFRNVSDLNETVEWMFLALQETINSRVIQNFIDDAKKDKRQNDFYNLCMYLLSHRNISDNKKRDFLLGHLFPNFKTLK